MSNSKESSNEELSNFAIARTITPTVGEMFGVDESGARHPVKINSVSLLGTNSQFGVTDKNLLGGNIQKVDTAFLPEGCDTLALAYGIRAYVDQKHNVEFCSNPRLFDVLDHMRMKYAGLGGYLMLAKRYMQRIASGYPLFRNRIGTGIQTEIHFETGETFNFKGTVDIEDVTLAKAAAILAEGLTGESVVNFRVTSTSVMGRCQEVYPSQELAMGLRHNGEDHSKVLAKDEKGNALVHPQKLGNAIRTIDVWYPGFAENRETPIAVEPFGTVLRRRKAFRHGKGKNSFYDYLASIVTDSSGNLAEVMNNANSLGNLPGDAHYFMAVLIRGGVLQLKNKKNQAED